MEDDTAWREFGAVRAGKYVWLQAPATCPQCRVRSIGTYRYLYVEQYDLATDKWPHRAIGSLRALKAWGVYAGAIYHDRLQRLWREQAVRRL